MSGDENEIHFDNSRDRDAAEVDIILERGPGNDASNRYPAAGSDCSRRAAVETDLRCV